MIIEGNNPYRQPSFSLSNRVMRLVWNIVYCLLFKLSPRPFHSWRALLLKVFGARLGENCHVYPGVNVWAPWNLILGNHVGIADGVTLYNMDKIEIGDYSVISQGAHLCGGTHDYNSKNFQLLAKPITVGRHVWVCAEVFIHPGVSVSDGVVIGARSVVTKSIQNKWKVFAGNPCREVADRKVLS